MIGLTAVHKVYYCSYMPRLGIITAENRQKYSTILCLVSCSLTQKFSKSKFHLAKARVVMHEHIV